MIALLAVLISHLRVIKKLRGPLNKSNGKEICIDGDLIRSMIR
jgi:hypothetical protein